MKSSWHIILAGGWCLGALAVANLVGGCAGRGPGHYNQVDVVDPHGYHHQGYYDDHHDWHGGYYDENHSFHDDPHDWHQ
jgi:hypothetical protein